MTKAWSAAATAYLARTDICPQCDSPLRSPASCDSCNADLSGATAAQVISASQVVVEAMLARQALIDVLPRVRAIAPVAAPTPASVTVPASTTPSAGSATNREGSQVSVQSVLAVVGAALLAVAAIVFTFLNPDLTNFTTRTAIVGVTTVVFLGGAWLLARAKLQFSAEAIGALGMVFVVLDVWAFSHDAPRQVSPFLFAGLGTVLSAIVMIAIAVVARIRTWLWLGLLGLAISPAWFGYAHPGAWPPVLGHLEVGAAALAVAEVARRLRSRFGSALRADQWMAIVVQLVVLAVVAAQLITLLSPANAPAIAASLTGLAALAALSARIRLARFWSFAAGALFTIAALELTLRASLADVGWFAAIVPAAAAAALALLSAATRVGSTGVLRVPRSFLVGGSAIALVASVVVTFAAAALQFVLSFAHFETTTLQFASSLGLAGTSLGLLAGWGLTSGRVSQGLRSASAIASLWFGVASVAAFADWDGLPEAARVGVALVSAVALCGLLKGSRPVRNARLSLRVPLLAGAHLLVLHAAFVAWSDPLLSELGGAAIVLTIACLALAVPRAVRPVHTALAFGYALVVFAHALQLSGLSTIALLSITTALASTVALVVTLLQRVPARYWYAVLLVTAIPFTIGIVDVLFVRSGWTALSTGVTFGLALTLLLTRRPGLSPWLRALAAALLVPALAVVVVCLGAQVLRVSASPITLPVIAVIVACVLPSTQLIDVALRRWQLSNEEAGLARRGIEISTLVTGALAVVLALVRAAAGLNTSFVVLLIVGIGAAATALLTHRRYAWIVAAASWTGALWCYWGILGIQVLEPYLLPPAIGAAIVGAVAVARRLPGLALYSAGLACAALPSVVILGGWGNGTGAPWRTYGLLAGSALLLALGATAARKASWSRIRTLATPTLLVATGAAAAGAIEGIRMGLGLNGRWLAGAEPLMVSALALGLLSALLAALGGRFLLTPERLSRIAWRGVYVPAVVYLVAGPIAAMRSGWLSVWTMLGLTLAILALMIATAARSRTRTVSLPPVWFLFGVAWCTAVVGWSDRALRVEAFSLPLGLSLLAVGILASRGPTQRRRSLTAWPVGFDGSWPLLAPGIVATFLPSILATGTDPQTLRAILVIALALLAILVGSLRRLGAPFVLGIIVLPVENITVFAAQIGHTISATSWWITLATAGAVLLVIAATWERRSGGERGVAARIRDLR
jgi:hypothetical protein